MAIEYDEPLFIKDTKVKRGRATVKASEKSHKVTLEEALTTLKALGFTINIPTSEEDRAKQDQTSSKLGFITAKPLPKTSKPLQKLRAVLSTAHRVGSSTYGPGDLELSLDQADLFRSLLQQDQACIRAHMDTADYVPQSHCYIIQSIQGKNRQFNYSKVEVAESVFNSEAFLTTTPAINTDIAGVKQESNTF